MEQDYDILVLNSGGFDSTVLLYDIKNKFPDTKVLTVFFEYGQNNAELERRCAYRTAKDLDFGFISVELPNFAWSKSSILSHNNKVGDLQDEYVEMRNLVFVSYAVSIAESYKVKDIYLAYVQCHLGFGDTSEVFVRLMDSLTFTTRGISILTPFINLEKEELVDIAREMNMPHTFFSCHYPNNLDEPCGTCEKCKVLSKINI